ncbi:MAG: gliding motility-associated C-terminal domain-containing protein [Flavobacteriales bacterium]|nr:gliding motility-associated C-terminal domain-containing protein [Flavobacteriales bacterium]
MIRPTAFVLAIAVPLLSALTSTEGHAQNLVPNPSFENYSSCPIGPGEIGNVISWSTPDSASPDYYNSCYSPLFPFPFIPSMDVPSNIQGYQEARTGNGYAGIISHEQSFGFNTDYREYLEVQLTQPMIAGQEYCVEFYWTLADKSVYYVGEIGAYFTPSNIFLPISTTLPFTPQVSMSNVPMNDTTNWVLFQGSFVASGGEQYMIIGNFNTPANTNSDTTGVQSNIFQTAGDFAYYFIEDVFVGTNCVTCVLDVTVDVEVDCENLSAMTLTASAPDLTADAIFEWSNGATGPNITVQQPGDYTVTVSDGACQGSGAIQLIALQPTVAQIVTTDTICAGDTLTLTAAGGSSYLWSTADTSASVTLSLQETTSFTVVATGDGGCQDSATVTIVVHAIPVLNLVTVDTSVCINSNLLLLEGNPESGIFNGIGVDTGYFNASLADVGEHWVYFSAGANASCTATDSLLITVEPDSCLLRFPTVISPGTDFEGDSRFCGMVHQNNAFQLPCLELYPGNRVQIFDRWGRRAFEATNYHLTPWDGNGGSEGVYYWVLELPDIETTYQGFFHLVK